ncbi:MAG: addiction module protein [Acidobacteria bacterium]|nr:addiction module protein [Acidobacteriota bacterium]
MSGLDLQQMTRAEKFKVMHALWEDLARDDAGVESPAWHESALRETEARVRDGVEQIHDWPAAKERLRTRG